MLRTAWPQRAVSRSMISYSFIIPTVGTKPSLGSALRALSSLAVEAGRVEAIRHRHRTLPELRRHFEDHRRHRRSAGDHQDPEQFQCEQTPQPASRPPRLCFAKLLWFISLIWFVSFNQRNQTNKTNHARTEAFYFSDRLIRARRRFLEMQPFRQSCC